jgi:hypothetical protein
MTPSLVPFFSRCWVFALLLFLSQSIVNGDQIRVRYTEGAIRGFLEVTGQNGEHLGDGDLQQVVAGDRVTSHLNIRFEDGSSFDDTTVFSQRRVFHLLTDHVIEKGPSFKQPMETFINASTGQVTVHYTDDSGKPKEISQHMQIPADVANGAVIFTVIKDIQAGAAPTTLSFVAATPKPRLVKLVITPQGEDTFITGAVRRRAIHYVMHIDIGGVAGVVAPLVGKKPPDTDLWVIPGDAPAFVGFQGPLSEGGPIWRMNVASPVPAKE